MKVLCFIFLLLIDIASAGKMKVKYKEEYYPLRELRKNCPVVIFGRNSCPYTQKAIAIMDKKNFKHYVFVDFNSLPEKVAEWYGEMSKKHIGVSTVPRIIVDEKVVGGFTELNNMDGKGELDPKLDKYRKNFDGFCGIKRADRPTKSHSEF